MKSFPLAASRVMFLFKFKVMKLCNSEKLYQVLTVFVALDSRSQYPARDISFHESKCLSDPPWLDLIYGIVFIKSTEL